MDLLTRYFGPIKQAMVVFPLIAGFFTLPYLLHEYRKYGAILFLRTLMVYSFILYMMCAYFLIILPLPPVEEVAEIHLAMASAETLQRTAGRFSGIEK